VGVRFGRYETLHPIASGGMATVHLARAVGAGGFERLVAIKVMHPGLSDDPEFSAMFLDEARVAARIRHPNVVGTVDVQEGQDGLFLVMEYVEGPSLAAITRALGKKRARLPIGLALRIVVDALLGLHAAHEQTGPDGEPLNIVHRDVSPQNILVGVDGQTKITDFGVARAEARLSSTRRGEVKGKLAYMCPEQVRTEPIDRRADVYAAGVVLWELLVGERLFKGDNDGALVLSVMMGAQRAPRQVDERIPEPVDRACMRALSLDVNARYPTALAFAEAIEAAAEEAGITLATPRGVAAFVKELAAHKPIDVPPMTDEPLSARTPRSSPSASRPVPVVAAPQPLDGPAPPRVAEADANSQVASVLSSPAALPVPVVSRARIGVAVAVVVMLAGLAVGSRFLGGEAPAAPAATSVPLTGAPSASASAEPAAPSSTAAATVSPPPPPVASVAPVAPSARATSARPPVTAPKAPRPAGGSEWKAQGL
jgi:eukaryotic-like serine/threonine-protein kinase